MKYLIVVDMQNDFTIGSLGSVHASAIIPNVLAKVKAFPGKVIFTRDTHGGDYLHTQKGKNCQFSLFGKPISYIQTETLLFVS
ncbi:MAG: isochorismatase family protein [Oscillospiraceae bacterium]|nr:isochorismatase family protein [Oscillospiraceae bacterium]MBP3672637.1 isochorismatase family protein [Oscillospiraceae bacterium]